MSSQTERLERVAAEERERLGEHLDQLQQKLENALDPAALYDRYPLPVLTAALVGGVVLGAVTQSDGPSRGPVTHEGEHRMRRSTSPNGGMLRDGMAQLRGAIVGMLVARLAEKVQELTTTSDAQRPKRSRGRPTSHDNATTPRATVGTA